MRGAYALWCREKGINYHELLVWYSFRNFGPCTQKQICEQYLLPKQTVHNIISDLKSKGYIYLQADEKNGRKKYIIPTASGEIYYHSIMDPLVTVEQSMVKQMGEKNLQTMTDLALHYGEILERCV